MTSASLSIPSRSLIAHEDSVTCVRFQPDTHYFFSGGKDGVLKYWDADRYGAHILPPHILAPPLLLSTTPLISLSPLHGVMYCKSRQCE
jgi:WD40 repeat protein